MSVGKKTSDKDENDMNEIKFDTKTMKYVYHYSFKLASKNVELVHVASNSLLEFFLSILLGF